MSRRHRVVVIGAGFGGLAAAKSLAKAPVDVLLIDPNNFHTFQPLLYQVATAGLDDDEIAYVVRGIFRRQRNFSFRMGRVTAIDLDARTVITDIGDPVEYDSLVVAAGAATATYGISGVAEYGFGLKSLDDAIDLRDHVLRMFELASLDPTRIDDGLLTIVIAGGGPTGVELAGGMMELVGMVLAKDFPGLDVHRARVVLVEMADRLLGTFAPRLSEKAKATLMDRGVEVLLGVGVDKVEHDAVHLTDGRRIPAGTMVWTAGVEAVPIVAALSDDPGPGGRTRTHHDLSLPDHPEVFVIGDAAASPDGHGGYLPGVGQVAIQGGRHAGRMIRARLDGRPTTPFHYRDKGSMATIGRRAAVAELRGGIRLSGTIGWVAWLGLHLVYLIGFRNRLNVLINWAWNYVTYDRGSRLITEDFPPGGRRRRS